MQVGGEGEQGEDPGSTFGGTPMHALITKWDVSDDSTPYIVYSYVADQKKDAWVEESC